MSAALWSIELATARFKTVKRLETKRGGRFLDGIHFRNQGGQVRSLLSLISYLGSGQNRERNHGVKIPPTNLQEHHLEQAWGFAGALADRLPQGATTAPASEAT